MKVRIIPLTFRWHLVAWRGGPRLAVGPVRTREDGRSRTIGATLSLGRFTVGLLRPARAAGLTTDEQWYRDFGRFSIGGWRTTGRSVPVSTGWMTDGAGGREGASITVASRSFYVMRMYRRAEYRAYRRDRAMHGPFLFPYSGRARKRRRG
ncbi:hypothetical protein EF903_17925 [Streptomyces sp. WAC05292]|uniref:hypothetical protein n=1 Tax=Streptomyces sp. WAC05292 TaxID=2487418 RepID=UPI000F735461|nr:hypothetical protein [Streptomyces sp. WAC05292]RSS86991.1 hypothetical protein EF903_17925 [Streptomyces sp. WAC05292]